MIGATGFQKQPHSRSSAQSTKGSSTQTQHDATAGSRASPTSFVCHSHGEYVCVVCVYTHYTAVLMHDMHGLVVESMLPAARLLVYTQLDRASSMQQTDISLNDLAPLPASSYSQQHLSISTGISIATASQQLRTV